MKSFRKCMKSLLVSEDGPTATEYAVMIALIILFSLGTIVLLGEKVEALFTDLDTDLSNLV